MKNKVLLILCFILITATCLHGNSFNRKNYIIPVSGEVGPAMASFIKRSVDQAENNGVETIIFEVDTFGGRVDSALEIVDTILSIDKSKSVTFVKKKAISAGALIALASGRLYMKKGTTIGDCAPITYSKEGVQEMGEKFQSPLRAKFRSLAKRNGFPQELAEAMVSKDKEILQLKNKNETVYMDKTRYDELPDIKKNSFSSKKTIVSKGELLTMDDIEARTLSFSEKSIHDLNELFQILEIEPDQITRLEKNWSEIVAGFLIKLSPILMLIGFAGIYLEFKSPGFGIPGIIGIVCLLLALASQYMTGLANYTELLLMVSGIIFLGVEVFVIPGFGISGILGITLILTGMILALQNFTIPDPKFPWQMDLFLNNILLVVGTAIAALILSIFLFRYFLPYLPMRNSPFLKKDLKKSHATSHETMQIKEEDTGTALSPLRPSGKALIAGQRIDVITLGDFIDPGDEVQVTQISQNRIIVAKKED